SVADWTVGGALSALGLGALEGAFYSTVVGAAYLVLRGVIDAVSILMSPTATPLQKTFGVGMAFLTTVLGALHINSARVALRSAVADLTQTPQQLFRSEEFQTLRAAHEAGQEAEIVVQDVTGKDLRIRYSPTTNQYGF